jgi:hypothetical protein
MNKCEEWRYHIPIKKQIVTAYECGKGLYQVNFWA